MPQTPFDVEEGGQKDGEEGRGGRGWADRSCFGPSTVTADTARASNNSSQWLRTMTLIQHQARHLSQPPSCLVVGVKVHLPVYKYKQNQKRLPTQAMGDDVISLKHTTDNSSEKRVSLLNAPQGTVLNNVEFTVPQKAPWHSAAALKCPCQPHAASPGADMECLTSDFTCFCFSAAEGKHWTERERLFLGQKCSRRERASV